MCFFSWIQSNLAEKFSESYRYACIYFLFLSNFNNMKSLRVQYVTCPARKCWTVETNVKLTDDSRIALYLHICNNVLIF